jgi:Surface-adhesin protein E
MHHLKGNRFRLRSLMAYIFLVFIGFYLPGHAEIWGAGWKYLEKDDEGIWFYDSENIECLANNIIRVWAKKIYDTKGVSAAVEKYGKDYMNLDHVLTVWEIHCSQKKFRLVSSIFFSKDNSIIQGYDDEKERYFAPADIPGDSYIELLHKTICR